MAGQQAGEAFKFPDETVAGSVGNDEIIVEQDDEIEVEDDTPEKDRGRTQAPNVDDPSEEELAQYSQSVRERIGALTHARHSERRDREARERELEEASTAMRRVLDENRALKETINNGSKQFVETAQSAADTSLEIAKRNYREAFETGDADKIMDAQAALTEATIRVQTAKNFKPTSLQVDESGVQNRATAPQPPPLDPKTTQWVSRNSWFGKRGNEDITSYALGLHQKLVNEGVDPRSDDYFERIDARLRTLFPGIITGGEKSTKSESGEGHVRPPPATVVAPSSRSTGPKRVRLTASQVAFAKRIGVTPQQYAAEVIKLEKANG